jgi:hypothetical protein
VSQLCRSRLEGWIAGRIIADSVHVRQWSRHCLLEGTTHRCFATLLAELAEVIARAKFVQRVQAAGLSAAELVQGYERLAEIVEPDPLFSTRTWLLPMMRRLDRQWERRISAGVRYWRAPIRMWLKRTAFRRSQR